MWVAKSACGVASSPALTAIRETRYPAAMFTSPVSKQPEKSATLQRDLSLSNFPGATSRAAKSVRAVFPPEKFENFD